MCKILCNFSNFEANIVLVQRLLVTNESSWNIHVQTIPFSNSPQVGTLGYSLYPLSAPFTRSGLTNRRFSPERRQVYNFPQSHKSRNVRAVYVIRRLITKGEYKIRGVYAKVERFTPQYSRAAGAARCGGVKAIKEVCPETVVYAAEVGYNQATVHKTTRQRYYCHLNGLSLRLDESSLAPSKRGTQETSKLNGSDCSVVIKGKGERVITTDRVWLVELEDWLACVIANDRVAGWPIVANHRGACLYYQPRTSFDQFWYGPRIYESAKIKCLFPFLRDRSPRLWGNTVLPNDNDIFEEDRFARPRPLLYALGQKSVSPLYRHHERFQVANIFSFLSLFLFFLLKGKEITAATINRGETVLLLL